MGLFWASTLGAKSSSHHQYFLSPSFRQFIFSDDAFLQPSDGYNHQDHPGRKCQSRAWDTAFKAVVSVMKTLKLRVVFQLRSGRASCNPRQANFRARVLNPGLGAGRTALESWLCHSGGHDLSKP